MSDLATLLTESLRAWHLPGDVSQAADGAIVVDAAKRLRITPAPPGVPFRWMVENGARQRGVTGIPGLLRAVHGALDPDYEASRLQIAARPVLA